MYWSAGTDALDPPGVVTMTSTVPDPAGAVTTTLVPLGFTLTIEACTPPKVTEVAPVSSVPVMVTLFPPARRAGGRRHLGDGRPDVGELVGRNDGGHPALRGDHDVDLTSRFSR